MAELNRRQVLVAGSVASAASVLAAPTPARAAAPWSWTPEGSVAGTGTGLDPRFVWDDEPDRLVADIIDRGDVDQVNALLRTWTKNAQPVPAGLPRELRGFIDRARQLPSWVDRGKLAKAVDFNKKRGIYLGLLYGLGSGMMSTAIPREARAVYYSQGGAAMKDRISKTAKLGYDIGSLDAFDPGGQMAVTGVKTRLVHSAVRHLLPQSAAWSGVADESIPISQRDIMVTWHSLPTYAMGNLSRWNVRIPPAESEGFLHSWQVGAHLLGVKDEYIPSSWPEATAQSRAVLDPLLGATPEGIDLADQLLSLAAEVDGGASRGFLHAMTRYLQGDRVADAIGIPREPLWDRFVATGWPLFVDVRERSFALRLPVSGYWAFDEFLRRGSLFFLSEGQPISIELPSANNPHYRS